MIFIIGRNLISSWALSRTLLRVRSISTRWETKQIIAPWLFCSDKGLEKVFPPAIGRSWKSYIMLTKLKSFVPLNNPTYIPASMYTNPNCLRQNVPKTTPKLFSSRHCQLCSSTVRIAPRLIEQEGCKHWVVRKDCPTQFSPVGSAAVLVLACGSLLEHNTKGDVSAGGKAVNH